MTLTFLVAVLLFAVIALAFLWNWRVGLVLFVAVFMVAQAFAGTTRSKAAVHAFMKAHPCPAGRDKGSTTRCAGHVVDHVKALDCGGLDAPSNMQWQTVAAAKAKDKTERDGVDCKHRTHV
jgi:hypothetical protein